MQQYLICYDLVDAGVDDYTDLRNELDSMGAERLQKSVWRVFDKIGSAKNIFDRLSQVMDEDDRLIVVKIDLSDSGEHNLIKGRTMQEVRVSLLETK